MNNHDLESIRLDETLLERISPQFKDLMLDIQEVIKHSSDPVFLAVLLFKLAKEREETNKLFEQINQKYDKVMFELKNSPPATQASSYHLPSKEEYSILCETDDKIMKFIEEKGRASAQEVQKEFGYKGQNGASARLNKLHKEGYLKKIQAGKTVFFIPR